MDICPHFARYEGTAMEKSAKLRKALGTRIGDGGDLLGLGSESSKRKSSVAGGLEKFEKDDDAANADEDEHGGLSLPSLNNLVAYVDMDNESPEPSAVGADEKMPEFDYGYDEGGAADFDDSDAEDLFGQAQDGGGLLAIDDAEMIAAMHEENKLLEEGEEDLDQEEEEEEETPPAPRLEE
jgi:hypothetical protein